MVVIDKNLVNIWGDMLALCLALLELLKAKGGPMTSLVALVRSVLLALPLETHQQGIPRDQGAFALGVSSCEWLDVSRSPRSSSHWCPCMLGG